MGKKKGKVDDPVENTPKDTHSDPEDDVPVSTIVARQPSGDPPKAMEHVEEKTLVKINGAALKSNYIKSMTRRVRLDGFLEPDTDVIPFDQSDVVGKKVFVFFKPDVSEDGGTVENPYGTLEKGFIKEYVPGRARVGDDNGPFHIEYHDKEHYWEDMTKLVVYWVGKGVLTGENSHWREEGEAPAGAAAEAVVSAKPGEVLGKPTADSTKEAQKEFEDKSIKKGKAGRPEKKRQLEESKGGPEAQAGPSEPLPGAQTVAVQDAQPAAVALALPENPDEGSVPMDVDARKDMPGPAAHEPKSQEIELGLVEQQRPASAGAHVAVAPRTTAEAQKETQVPASGISTASQVQHRSEVEAAEAAPGAEGARAAAVVSPPPPSGPRKRRLEGTTAPSPVEAQKQKVDHPAPLPSRAERQQQMKVAPPPPPPPPRQSQGEENKYKALNSKLMSLGESYFNALKELKQSSEGIKKLAEEFRGLPATPETLQLLNRSRLAKTAAVLVKPNTQHPNNIGWFEANGVKWLESVPDCLAVDLKGVVKSWRAAVGGPKHQQEQEGPKLKAWLAEKKAGARYGTSGTGAGGVRAAVGSPPPPAAAAGGGSSGQARRPLVGGKPQGAGPSTALAVAPAPALQQEEDFIPSTGNAMRDKAVRALAHSLVTATTSVDAAREMEASLFMRYCTQNTSTADGANTTTEPNEMYYDRLKKIYDALSPTSPTCRPLLRHLLLMGTLSPSELVLVTAEELKQKEEEAKEELFKCRPGWLADQLKNVQLPYKPTVTAAAMPEAGALHGASGGEVQAAPAAAAAAAAEDDMEIDR